MNLVQYVILRKDLQTALNWPLGAIIAQGCHASVAAVGKFWADESTKSYLADLDRMHKVVLEVGDEVGLRATAAALTTAGVDHVLWTEEPEGIPTAVATKPGPQKDLKPILRHLKLFS